METPSPTRPLIVAHRGASHKAPENTIEAFELAWELGADAIEGDFRLTADDQIVCIHDADTGRVADRRLVVSETCFSELRQLDVGSHFDGRFADATIPSIAEVFASVPGAGSIFIEIKSGVEILPGLIEQIRLSGLRQGQVTVISFNDEVVRAFKVEAPHYRALWLVQLLRNTRGELMPTAEMTINALKRTGADGFGSSSIITEAYLRRIKSQGYDCHIWQVDDLESARRFAAWGADSIGTNLPGYMKSQW